MTGGSQFREDVVGGGAIGAEDQAAGGLGVGDEQLLEVLERLQGETALRRDEALC